MSPDDYWPKDYTPGAFLHLHALGAVAMNIASFETNLDSLYFQVETRLGRAIEEIADLIRVGQNRSLDMRLYITYHGQPVDKIPRHLRPYVPQALPKKLQIPQSLTRTPRP